MDRPGDRRSTPALQGGLAALLVLAGCQGASLDRTHPPQGWQRLYPAFAAPVYDLLRDPENPQVIYAACGWQPISRTQFGGVYRSADPDRRWRPLDPHYERIAVSSMAMDSDGTLWVGLRNAGLAARSADDLVRSGSLDTFKPQGEPLLEQVGILTVRAAHGEVVAGTMGEGAVFGRYDGRFETVQEGLENKTVSAILLDPDMPGEVILGTWAGLYRSVPSRMPVWPWVLAVAVAPMALTAGIVLWRRSDWAVAVAAFRDMSKVPDFIDSANRLNRVGIEVPLQRRKHVLECFAWLIGRADHPLRDLRAEGVLATARTLGLLDIKDGRARVSARQELATAMDGIAQVAEAVTKRAESLGIAPQAAGADHLAEQTRLFAALLRAESPGHLAALRPRFRQVAQNLTEAPSISALDKDLVEELRVILDALEQLSRLPSAEDRALFLGQALSKCLQAQERLAQRYVSKPTHSSAFAVAVVESLRQLLATAMQDVHQRAELVVELCSKVLSTRREAVVVLEIRNVGQGHAHNVTVELRDDFETLRVLQPRQDVKSLLRHQSARLEFLVEPKVSDRLRLDFLITYGDLERHDQHFEFADVAEFRQLSTRTFFPLSPNPYVVGRPLADSDVFIGREKTFELVTANLRGSHQDNVVILIGQRRMGKTSILRRLPAHLGDDYVPVLVDLQGLLGAGEAALFRDLTAVVHDELAAAGVFVDEPPAGDFEIDPATVFKRRFLRDAKRALGDRRLLLMFDEFEVLEERIRSGDLKPRILPYLRSLMQHEVRISFMFAGTHRLDELTSDYWSVLFNLAVYLDVGHLSQSEVEELFTRPTRPTFEIDSLALEKIYQATGGHPHFSQLLARELVELCNREMLSYVTVQDVNVVTETVVDKGQLHIAYLWNEAPRSERLLLLALKELIEREGLASTAAAHRYLADRRIEPGDLPAAARRLVRLQILSENAGQLSFRIDLLRRWLERRHDLESFVLSEGGQ